MEEREILQTGFAMNRTFCIMKVKLLRLTKVVLIGISLSAYHHHGEGS